MLLALQLQHAALLREHRIASTAHLLPSDMVGAATRTAEVATQTEEDRRARFANLQDGRGVSGRGVSGRGDAASRNVSGRMGGSTGHTGRRSVGWMALKAELEHMLSPQRMQMQFDAWADGSVFDASEEEEEEAGGGGCCPCRRRRRMRIRRSRSSRPGRDTDRGTDLDDLAPPSRCSSCAASRARRVAARPCARRSAFDTRRQVLQFST